MGIVLEARNIETHFFTRAGIIPAVNKVSFSVKKGETLAIVGESGCGKSVTALSILGLVPSPPGRIVGGEIFFYGRDLLKLSPKEMRRIRGKDISMIFQEPMTSLNPVSRVGNQICEVILTHENVSRRVAFKRSEKLLDMVGIGDPSRCMRTYPHKLSGGMRQRVMIAMAVVCNPMLLIADEPTTALDVTIQEQVLHLLKRLMSELDMALILITHDFGVVAETADKVIVMYAGNKVEEALVEQLFEHQLHPYTQDLLKAIPQISWKENYQNIMLYEIPGIVPSLLDLPKGCPFAPRCQRTIESCWRENPKLTSMSPSRQVACFRALVP